jgi:FMN hydrolase / 5-amino-6-(5-phospho-D-ribitylamino)uracil phosphatase
VKDPFYEHMPPHFGMTFKELLAAKHPTTWLEFERGDIGEEEALSRFWADGKAVDGNSLRRMLVRPFYVLRFGHLHLISAVGFAAGGLQQLSNHNTL